MSDASPPDQPIDPGTDPEQEHTMTDETHETTEQMPDTTAAVGGRRRSLDVTSLVAGVVVLAITAAFVFGEPDSLHEQGRVVGPLVLLGVGVALLVGSVRR